MDEKLLEKKEKCLKDLYKVSYVIKNMNDSSKNFEKVLESSNPLMKNALISNYICNYAHLTSAIVKTALFEDNLEFQSDPKIKEMMSNCELQFDTLAKYFTEKFDELARAHNSQLNQALYQPDSNYAANIIAQNQEMLDYVGEKQKDEEFLTLLKKIDEQQAKYKELQEEILKLRNENASLIMALSAKNIF